MKQVEHAIGLRDAAVELLRKQGTRVRKTSFSRKRRRATRIRAYRFCCPGFHPTADSTSAWAPREDWYGKVLSVEWLGDRIKLINFLRGEWELDLLAVAALTQ
jgi:hypothetical protein